MAIDLTLSSKAAEKRLWIALGVSLLIVAVEVTGGVLGQSLALLGDSAHVLTDVLTVGIAILTLRLNTHRSSTRDHIPGISATSTASKGPRPARPFCRITWSNRKLDHGRTAGSEPKDKSQRQRRFSTRPRRHSLLTRRNHQQPHHNHHRIQWNRSARGRADRSSDHSKRLRP